MKTGSARTLVGNLGLLLLVACATTEPARYTFSRPLDLAGEWAPRGGTTTGPSPEIDPAPHPGWVALQEEGLTPFERDRRAILAMAGPYRVSFDFLETYSLVPGPVALDVPYQSWATEYVYLLEDRGDFISLQHIMVMFFEMHGEVVGPSVTKHWRQDWTWQDRDLHVYRGHGRWERRRVGEDEARGAWSQAVFQVDDSPRYEALGHWHHDGNLSYWQSETTWRPLPRREFSVRDDYHALVGTNRHVITPRGWIHEQENAKRRVPSPGVATDGPRYLSKEIGLNRYLRVRDHDFAAGDAYWEKTALYWSEVRAAWREIYETHEVLEIAATHDDTPLYVRHFAEAEESAEGEHSQKEIAEVVRATLADYVRAPSP